jgi:hypothetical protein
MIEGIVKGIMLTGLNKYAKINETVVDKIQIKISDNIEGYVFYDICKDFKTTERVSFTNIMDKKIDILGYGSFVNPKLKEFLSDFAEENNFELEKTCCFILKHNDLIYLSFYHGVKNIKTIPLRNYLAEKGL